MPYLEISFQPVYSEEDKAFLMAELMQAGFESFNEEESRLLGYIDKDAFTNDLPGSINFLKSHPGIRFDIVPLEDKNWNSEWESHYTPVTIDGKCHVRAPFHPPVHYMAYEIVIEPKMAFGTAHHETTRLMATWLMKLDVKDKTVLDMGCGTGILAVLANKMGAATVTGIDNDEWAFRNATENFSINEVNRGEILLGDASLVIASAYDLILANINRNVLLADMRRYADGLRKDGLLMLSGFYKGDIEAVTSEASRCGLRNMGHEALNEWVVLLFEKYDR